MCNNEEDDDGDGEIDYAGGPLGEPADSDCIDMLDDDEYGETPTPTPTPSETPTPSPSETPTPSPSETP